MILFFVLSGFVIAFSADTKDRTWKRFAFNRASRLCSVALPAIVLTLLFDSLGSSADRSVYEGWWSSPISPVLAAPVSMLFANEWGPLGVRIGTNGPYWSLSYEAAYYVLFGCAFYLCGMPRGLLLIAGSTLFGLQVLLLLPAWVLGAVVYFGLAAPSAGWPAPVFQSISFTTLPCSLSIPCCLRCPACRATWYWARPRSWWDSSLPRCLSAASRS